MSYELDQKNPETLINAPAPYCPDWFHQTLEQIGGKQLDGKPNLRVIWGQTERKFACGRERVKYPTSFYAEKADYTFRLRNIETNEVTLCTYEEFMLAKKAYEAADPDITHLAEYKVTRDVEWIGYPRWIIEQYEPVVLLKDSPAAWELHRYGWWFNPETKKQEWTDLIGPFPYEGRYNHFLTIKEDDGTDHGKYKAPSEGEITLIKQALQAREEYKSVSVEQAIKNYKEAQEARLEKAETELSDEIANSLAPHVNQMFETKVKFYK